MQPLTGPTPTGIVTFLFSTNGGLNWTQLGSTKTLSGGRAVSDLYKPAVAGNNYRLRAIYGGDSNYSGSQSANNDEPLTVRKANSTTNTHLSASTIIRGGSVTDTAMVVGLGGSFPTPTGAVTFQVSTNGGFSWTKLGTTKTLSGGPANSDAYTPASRGFYLFRAVYSDDTNYNGSQSANYAELLMVR